ncbi:DUF1203 domain-containing protein [Novosphingobium gossypii]|uniref:DUF1203 domain-containing protein n=1 Tax=Novosphingobium gossypii TaxID=1604774 RepID=UPI003D21D3F4
MTYRITGLPRVEFTRYFAADTEELRRMGGMRVVADADAGYPCRVSLEDARAGESVLLLNFTSHDVPGPFRTAYAIYVREVDTPGEGRSWLGELPPSLAVRTLSLRGFDVQGLLRAARLAEPAGIEAGIADLFASGEVAYIHAHYATYGCFAARIDRVGVGDER